MSLVCAKALQGMNVSSGDRRRSQERHFLALGSLFFLKIAQLSWNDQSIFPPWDGRRLESSSSF